MEHKLDYYDFIEMCRIGLIQGSVFEVRTPSEYQNALENLGASGWSLSLYMNWLSVYTITNGNVTYYFSIIYRQ